MIVGMNLTEYVLVASDKREVLLIDSRVETVLCDNVNKIIDWNGGYITGSGYVEVLNDLKNEISNNEITSTYEIIDLAVRISNFHGKRNTAILDSSNWMITYTTETPTGNECRIGIISARKPNEMRALCDMTSTIWAKIPNLDSEISILNGSLRPIQEFSGIDESITYHASLLNQLFIDMAKCDETVCSSYDFCVQLRDGSKAIRINA